MDKKNKLYAGQLVDVARSNQHLTVTDCLKKMTEDEGEPYLNVFSKKSVYYMSIFNFGSDKPVSVSANIPLRDIAEIRAHTDISTQEIFKNANKPVMKTVTAATVGDADLSSSIANTKLKTGNKIAGLSPIEVLIRDGDAGVKELGSQFQFLKQNLGRYPNNQKEMDAITEGVKLYRSGKLTNAQPSADNSGQVLKIYERPDKYFKEKNSKGYNKCYSIGITCTPGKGSPYRVSIKNYFAPIIVKSNGTTPIQYSAKEDETAFYVDLLEGEWLNMLDIMEENMRAARYTWYKGLRDKDNENRWSPDKERKIND